MENLLEKTLRLRIKLLLIFFIVSLTISGLTAFPLETELSLLVAIIPSDSMLFQWVNYVYHGIKSTNENFPFIAYGTDWLAFAHLIIAIVFIGPLKDPVKNIWVIQFGIIACLGIIPLAFIAGEIREIPIYWRLIDCSFGIIGILPLMACHKYIKSLECLLSPKNLNHIDPSFDELKIYDL